MGLFSGVSKALGAVAAPVKLGSSILGGANLLGGAYSAKRSIDSQRAINERQIDLSREQMEFQREMSNTAYQRAMKDMRKAGLNPILAYKQGGASTPGGAMAKLLDPVTQGLMVGSQVANTGANLMQTGSNIGKQEAEIQKMGAEMEKIDSEIQNHVVGRKLTRAQTLQMTKVIWQTLAQTKKIMEETKGISFENARREALNELFTQYPKAAWAKEFNLDATAVSKLVGDVIQSINPKSLFKNLFGNNN